MKLLPSEQEQAKMDAVKIFNQVGAMVLDEPCNCGNQVRHNNGGNYHEWIEIVTDSASLYARFGDTCALKPEPEWEPISRERAIEVIQDRASRGYDYDSLDTSDEVGAIA